MLIYGRYFTFNGIRPVKWLDQFIYLLLFHLFIVKFWFYIFAHKLLSLCEQFFPVKIQQVTNIEGGSNYTANDLRLIYSLIFIRKQQLNANS